MGFLSNLFSKQKCAFCDKEVGALNRKKLHDGNYICKECEKNCSAFIDPARFDTEYIRQHMEYMKKQDRSKYTQIANEVQKRAWAE